MSQKSDKNVSTEGLTLHKSAQTGGLPKCRNNRCQPRVGVVAGNGSYASGSLSPLWIVLFPDGIVFASGHALPPQLFTIYIHYIVKQVPFCNPRQFAWPLLQRQLERISPLITGQRQLGKGTTQGVHSLASNHIKPRNV